MTMQKKKKKAHANPMGEEDTLFSSFRMKSILSEYLIFLKKINVKEILKYFKICICRWCLNTLGK